MCMTTRKYISFFEVTGSVLAIVYALLIASNTGNEILGFTLLLISSGLFAAWALIDKHFSHFSFSMRHLH
jgi:hypothetical protein